MKENIKLSNKRLQKFGEIYWIFGVIFVALGVAICSKANLGVSMIAAPPFIIQEWLLKYTDWFSVGTIEYLFQGLLLILLCIVVRRFKIKYIFSFLVAFTYGLVLDLWLLILGREVYDSVWLRWIMLFVGDLITALGVACFFRTYLPLQVYELVVSEVADKYNLAVPKTKLYYDIISLVLSIVLAFLLNLDANTFDWSKLYSTSYHYIGAGTIITTFINAPLIALFGKILQKLTGQEALLPNVKNFFTRH